MDGGNHHLRGAVDRQQGVPADFQQTVAVCNQLDFPFPGLGAVDVPAGGSPVQQRRRFIFVQDAGLFLPDVEVLFANAQQNRDVLGLDDMALAEPGALELAGDDLGDIVAEHLACRVYGTDQFHCFTFSLQGRHLGADPVGQGGNLLQAEIGAGYVAYNRQRLDRDRCL